MSCSPTYVAVICIKEFSLLDCIRKFHVWLTSWIGCGSLLMELSGKYVPRVWFQHQMSTPFCGNPLDLRMQSNCMESLVFLHFRRLNNEVRRVADVNSHCSKNPNQQPVCCFIGIDHCAYLLNCYEQPSWPEVWYFSGNQTLENNNWALIHFNNCLRIYGVMQKKATAYLLIIDQYIMNTLSYLLLRAWT